MSLALGEPPGDTFRLDLGQDRGLAGRQKLSCGEANRALGCY